MSKYPNALNKYCYLTYFTIYAAWKVDGRHH
jgi:hypothetical protein